MAVVKIEAWTRIRVPEGVLLVHPGGEHYGLVRIHRGAPARSLRAVLAEIVERSRARLGAASCVDVRTIITREGEHASLAVLRGAHPDGRSLDRHVGIILGDGMTIQLEGFCRRGERELARELEGLIVHLVTNAARERRRMFMYRPPPGWSGARRSFSTLWLAPGFPRNPATLEVHDAIPTGHPGALLAHALGHAVGSPSTEDESSIAVGPLVGTRGPRGATLGDERFRYEVELVDPGGEYDGVLAALVDSIEPIPSPAVRHVADHFEWVL
jgi:hypothetical protein